MKTTNKIKASLKKLNTLLLLTTGLFLQSNAQELAKPDKKTLAVINIDSKGISQEAESISYMVRLELEKINTYNIMDKYDLMDALKKNNIDLNSCYGKSCIISTGKILSVDKMLSGNVERFGEKIIIALRLFDVKTETLELSNTTEYLNLQPELQKMIEISLKKLLSVETDKVIVEQLVNYNTPISTPKTELKLNGPRMGFAMASGETGQRMKDSKDKGGFDMYPLTFQFGFQKEFQYLSAGDFQALIEFVGLAGGLESGKFIPSLTLLNGFRWNTGGWEFGFGPSFKFVKKADGFYDMKGYIGEKGEWHLKEDYGQIAIMNQNNSIPYKIEYPIISRLDSRGSLSVSSGLVFAAGKTFKSGYLNMPVNLYVSPRKDGWTYGFSFGFNIYKKPKN